jgi:hypothetical protein
METDVFEKSEKQKQFEAGVKFRIGTERTSAKRYYYVPDVMFIKSTDNNIVGEVLELNQYSIKLKHEILGQPLATYIRFENVIFDKP